MFSKSLKEKYIRIWRWTILFPKEKYSWSNREENMPYNKIGQNFYLEIKKCLCSGRISNFPSYMGKNNLSKCITSQSSSLNGKKMCLHSRQRIFFSNGTINTANQQEFSSPNPKKILRLRFFFPLWGRYFAKSLKEKWIRIWRWTICFPKWDRKVCLEWTEWLCFLNVGEFQLKQKLRLCSSLNKETKLAWGPDWGFFSL